MKGDCNQVGVRLLSQTIGPAGRPSSGTRGGSGWILENILSLPSTGIGCPRKWLSHHPWRNIKDLELRFLGFGLVVWLAVGLNLESLFQLEQFYEILITWSNKYITSILRQNKTQKENSTCSSLGQIKQQNKNAQQL